MNDYVHTLTRTHVVRAHTHRRASQTDAHTHPLHRGGSYQRGRATSFALRSNGILVPGRKHQRTSRHSLLTPENRVHIHIRAHTHSLTHVHACIRTYTHTHTHTHIHIHTYTHIYPSLTYSLAHSRIHSHSPFSQPLHRGCSNQCGRAHFHRTAQRRGTCAVGRKHPRTGGHPCRPRLCTANRTGPGFHVRASVDAEN